MFYNTLNNIKISTRFITIIILLLVLNFKFQPQQLFGYDLPIYVSYLTINSLFIINFLILGIITNQIKELTFNSFGHFFFSLGICFIPLEYITIPFALALLLNLILISNIFSIKLQFNKKKLFFSGIIVAFITVIDSRFIILLPWLYLCQIAHRDFNIYKWIAVLFGFFSIWTPILACLQFTNYQPIELIKIVEVNLDFKLNDWIIIGLGLGIILSSFSYINFKQNLTLESKEKFTSIFILAVLLILFYFVERDIILITIAPFALIMGYWFGQIKKRKLREFLLYLFFLLAFCSVVYDFGIFPS